jgi:hypothetical protein
MPQASSQNEWLLLHLDRVETRPPGGPNISAGCHNLPQSLIKCVKDNDLLPTTPAVFPLACEGHQNAFSVASFLGGQLSWLRIPPR